MIRSLTITRESQLFLLYGPLYGTLFYVICDGEYYMLIDCCVMPQRHIRVNIYNGFYPTNLSTLAIWYGKVILAITNYTLFSLYRYIYIYIYIYICVCLCV